MVANLSCKSRLSPVPWISIFSIGCSVGFSFNPAPVLAARTVSAIYGPLEISASVNEIESFAQTGAAPASLQPILQFLSPKQQSDLRNVLQQKLKVEQQSVLVFGRTDMGKDLLQRLSTVIRSDPGQDGKVMLFKGIAYANEDPQGLTVLSLFRNYPVNNLRLNVEPLLQAQTELTALLKYRDTSVQAIEQEMRSEIAATPSTDFAQLPDYRQPGPFTFIRRKLNLPGDPKSTDPKSSDPNRSPSSKNIRPLDADLYLPQQQSRPSPVVIISHGLGSAPSNYSYLAQHLASYGFAVVLPQHTGSDASHLESVLEGQALDDVNPTEFANRPLDIKNLLDGLTQLATTDINLNGQLDLQHVGIIGHSFGAYTSLAVAGATVDQSRIKEQCESPQPTFNLSLILQCRARELPSPAEALSDSRIKAVIAVNPFASTVFGPKGIGSIQIPTMVVSSSNDILTPAIPEQIYPFLWLKTPKKYLALLINAGHTFPTDSPSQFSSDSQKGLRLLLSGADPQLAREYLQALSLAFMKTHLAQQPDAERYLSASYAQHISQSSVKLDLVRSLTPAQLEQAYGGPLPLSKLLPVGDAVQGERTSTKGGVNFFASPQRWFEYYAERFLVSLKKELGRFSLLS